MIRGTALTILGLWLPGCVLAGDVPLRSEPRVDLLQWTLAFGAVLLALFVFALALRRLGQFSRLEPGSFKVLAALSLGSRERVVLVQAGAKQLVLGVAPGRVQTLCVLEGEEAIRLSGDVAQQEPFVRHFKHLMSGRDS
ncbi:flagellar biosynthetic protein FliO [Methyloterricola oryzae]|uniref:flagellar biosynthetic protein FliO n=1 Tax=Methyloterricola oryzae TaxID=1495050 RepID=UPI0005EB9FAD|nr:flagellar biosynthetic protein FliO [Methyloterricola oryzae]